MKNDVSEQASAVTWVASLVLDYLGMSAGTVFKNHASFL